MAILNPVNWARALLGDLWLLVANAREWLAQRLEEPRW
jgi:hypothetical protein